MLLFGALLGLFAQEAAFASSPAVQQHEMIAAAPGMSAECAEMMGLTRPEKSEAPCKGLTLDCIAKMGCALPLAAPTFAAPIVAVLVQRALVGEQLATPLVGHNLGPEPDPPLIFG